MPIEVAGEITFLAFALAISTPQLIKLYRADKEHAANVKFRAIERRLKEASRKEDGRKAVGYGPDKTKPADIDREKAEKIERWEQGRL